jgi:hypothetical protein
MEGLLEFKLQLALLEFKLQLALLEFKLQLALLEFNLQIALAEFSHCPSNLKIELQLSLILTPRPRGRKAVFAGVDLAWRPRAAGLE